MRRISHLAALMVAVLFAFCGCAALVVSPPAVAGPPKPTGTWRAGALRVDLTPPPGFPMGGHSLAGQVARGYWTRLYVRAIYLEDPEGHRLALVACDLWAMPAGLADRVAELIALDPHGKRRPPAEIPLARDQIVIAATHTHQSPGNFSSASAYNAFGSPRPGFDRRLFEFLAHRIADAIAGAILAARPAVVTYAEGSVPGLARNRSFPPFLRNAGEAESILADNTWLPEAPVPGGYPQVPGPYSPGVIYRAVSPRLSVMSMRDRSDPTTVIAIAAFVAAHPTTISHRTPLYTSDFFGVAAALAARVLRKDSRPSPIIAIFNGAEGDVSPAWLCRDPGQPDTCQERVDAIALGRVLAQRIVEVNEQGAPISGRVEHRFARRLALADQCLLEQPSLCTAKEPMIGAPMVGGAPDGRSGAHGLGWREGATGRVTDRQGPKRPAFDPQFLSADSPIGISRFVLEALSTPSVMPLGLYRIGSVLLATIPGEFTTVMGRRIERALAAAMAEYGRPVQHVILVGLANEYISYFTTPEEYALQYYEGASTVYGPASGPLVLDRLVMLARQFDNAPVPEEEAIAYSPGPGFQFGVWDVNAPATSLEGLEGILQDEAGQPLSDPPRICWLDRFPILPLPYDSRRVTPTASIEVRGGRGDWQPFISSESGEENDKGINFVTTASAAFPLRSRWCVMWLGRVPPGPDIEARFHVRTLRGTSLYAPVRRPEPDQREAR